MSWQIINGKIGEYTGVTYTLPLGFYCESYFPEQDLERMLDVITTGGEMGMNLVYLRISDNDATRQLVEQAVSYGMKIGIEPNGPTDERCVEIVGKENVAFILNQDDQENKTLIECETRYNDLKQAFPDIPIYSTGYKLDAASQEKRAFADISAQQAYHTGQAPDVTAFCFEKYTEATGIAPVNFANPQCYIGYENTPPTKKQIVEFGLTALLRCKGLLWYSFYYWDHKTNTRTIDILNEPEWLDSVRIVTKFARDNEALFLGE